MWITITLIATIFQIARTSEQHRLKGILNPFEAAYVRFAFAVPLALAGAAGWFLLTDEAVPSLNARFWASVVGAGVAQILATIALLMSFRHRDFGVGTIYSKTEVVFIGIGSTVLLGEGIGPVGWVGALLCICGVVVLASHGRLSSDALTRFDPAAAYGIAAGLGFGLAALGIRSATSALDGSAPSRAFLTLAAMLTVQTVLQGISIARSATSSLRRIASAWRRAGGVAVLSLAGSAAWAWAIALENAARVRTLGQIEILLAFAIGIVVHGERHDRVEYAAAAVTAAGIVLVVVT